MLSFPAMMSCVCSRGHGVWDIFVAWSCNHENFNGLERLSIENGVLGEAMMTGYTT